MGRREERVRALTVVLSQGVRSGAFPGAVASIGETSSSGAPRVHACAGQLEPGGGEVGLDTPYDLASLTKPVVALSALRLAQQGVVDLHVPVARFLRAAAGTHGGRATLFELLSHRAGLAAWGKLYESCSAPLGSAAMQACMIDGACRRTAENLPAFGPPPAIYSDLGYLLAGQVLASAAQCDLCELVRREVTAPLGIAGEMYFAAALASEQRAELKARVAPTERDPWRGRIVRGEVHDENCAAFGGIAGHAGLFGTSRAVLELGLCVLDALAGRSRWLDRTLLEWALRPQPGGTHLCGWDSKSEEGSSAGESFSRRAFGHLGFTGTSLWCDPSRELCAVLLSNRVHPSRENVLIRSFRPAFHDAAVRLWFGSPGH